jgi:hypothetical protein
LKPGVRNELAQRIDRLFVSGNPPGLGKLRERNEGYILTRRTNSLPNWCKEWVVI